MGQEQIVASAGTGGQLEPSSTIVECDSKYCGTRLPKLDTYHGHCSDWCYHIRRGQNLLNNIRYDHRFCYGCMRQLKEIERPPESKPDFVVGFQYTTQFGTHGQKTVFSTDYQNIDGTGTICDGCGQTDHTDDFYESKDVQERAKRLFSILSLTGKEGQHDKTLDVRSFIDAWNESKNWAYSVGKAIE